LTLDAGRFGGSSRSDEKIHLAPNVFAIADSSAVRFGRWTGYETIDKGAQRDEVADWSPRDRYHCETARHQIEHPIRDLVSSSMRLPDKELVNTVMLVVADHQDGLAEHWIKLIGNNCFECQKPGIMASARMRAAKTEPAWHH